MHPRAINTIFSRPTMRSLGRGVVPDQVKDLLRVQWDARITGESSLADFFNAAYQALTKHYRSEYVYKNELVSRVVFGRHSPRTTSFQTEFRVGSSIADAVVFNGTSTVYEVKTELDGLQRLQDQLAAYRSVFDRIFVVTHETGVDAVLRAAPSAVGVLQLTRRGSLKGVRESRANAQNVSPLAIFNTLRRYEYLDILEGACGWTGDVPASRIASEAKRRFLTLDPLFAHEQALLKWRERTTTGSLPGFVSALPPSLRTLGLSEPLSEVARTRVLNCLAQPLAFI